MHELRQAADEMKEALLKGRIRTVLEVLGRSWHAKKRAAAAISNPAIERIADRALSAGASGLKISGAGGGGFMMIAVEPARRFDVMRALEPLGGRFFGFTFVEQGVQSWKSH
jgi:D-glycero-alpha-D-manno-heptose-7-phosphate kinase